MGKVLFMCRGCEDRQREIGLGFYKGLECKGWALAPGLLWFSQGLLESGAKGNLLALARSAPSLPPPAAEGYPGPGPVTSSILPDPASWCTPTVLREPLVTIPLPHTWFPGCLL